MVLWGRAQQAAENQQPSLQLKASAVLSCVPWLHQQHHSLPVSFLPEQRRHCRECCWTGNLRNSHQRARKRVFPDGNFTPGFYSCYLLYNKTPGDDSNEFSMP